MHYTVAVCKKHYIQVNWIHRIAALLCFKILGDQNFNIWKIYKKRNKNANHEFALLLQLKWHVIVIVVLGEEGKTLEDKEVVAKRERGISAGVAGREDCITGKG